MVEYVESVGVVVYYYVREIYIVVCGEVGSYDMGEYGFFVEFNVVESFKCEVEVIEKVVDLEEVNDWEVV